MHSIRFYRTHDKYGAFSNFSRHGFVLDGAYWTTVEHYFQAQKFVSHPVHYDAVRLARTPSEAARIGRERTRPLRAEWEQVKDVIMERAVVRKFETHEALRRLLSSTGQARIIEASPRDVYWGEGTDGKGLNRLGEILMAVRAELGRQTDSPTDVLDAWYHRMLSQEPPFAPATSREDACLLRRCARVLGHDWACATLSTHEPNGYHA